jgi:HD domain-containing protein
MIYRLQQGLSALLAWSQPVDDQAARVVLSPALMALFHRMRRSEQIHSLRVMADLQARGVTNPDLLTAALLHDCGKSRYPFSLLERTLVVIIRKLAPNTFARWASGEPQGWRRMAVISAHHPEWSAQDMQAAGASEQAVSLARRHQEHLSGPPQTDEDRLLALLQSVDDRS